MFDNKLGVAFKRNTHSAPFVSCGIIKFFIGPFIPVIIPSIVTNKRAFKTVSTIWTVYKPKSPSNTQLIRAMLGKN